MSRIDELIAELCPDGVEFKMLGEVGEFIRGNGLQKKDLEETGLGAIHYGQIHTHYGIWATETKSFVGEPLASRLRKARPGDLVIATTSEDNEAVAKAVAWIGNDEVAVSGDAYIYRHTLEPKYAAYFFQSEQFQDQKKRHITGAKVRRISGESLAKICVPVPPLEIQREIVKVLDTFTKLEAELKAELEAELEMRRRQYQYYRDELLTFSERTDADASKQASKQASNYTVDDAE
jgi:type I restriction enzyme S subunit